MQTPVNASASTAGALLSSSQFIVPQFQREYSWAEDEVADFWNDLCNNLDSDSYFLGLVILTEEGDKKNVVDGQQRLITLTLLATAIHHEALQRGRKALADRIEADFLRAIDYESDETKSRIGLSDETDNETFQNILSRGDSADADEESVAYRIIHSYRYLSERLKEDIKTDPFKRLGRWTEFLTHRVYFAVFVHPDPASAYQVYEVINTRGKELTTADLLKNYVISEAIPEKRQLRYKQWQAIGSKFSSEGANAFVQFIRHVVTVRSGHILPKDLFGFLAGRMRHDQAPPSPDRLMGMLKKYLPIYLQMIDPSQAGPAEPDALKIFAALEALGVIAVRPILLAASDTQNSLMGMKYVLRLVVRRIVVGGLGTGNVERKFGEAAKRVRETGDWKVLSEELGDLNPPQEEFIEQLRKRTFSKSVLRFLRNSILQNTITPDLDGVLHFIWTSQAAGWRGMSEEDGSYWGATIGNSFLARVVRRSKEAEDWPGFKRTMLPEAVDHEWNAELGVIREWNAEAVERMGQELAEAAGKIWYK